MSISCLGVEGWGGAARGCHRACVHPLSVLSISLRKLQCCHQRKRPQNPRRLLFSLILQTRQLKLRKKHSAEGSTGRTGSRTSFRVKLFPEHHSASTHHPQIWQAHSRDLKPLPKPILLAFPPSRASVPLLYKLLHPPGKAAERTE